MTEKLFLSRFIMTTLYTLYIYIYKYMYHGKYHDMYILFVKECWPILYSRLPNRIGQNLYITFISIHWRLQKSIHSFDCVSCCLYGAAIFRVTTILHYIYTVTVKYTYIRAVCPRSLGLFYSKLLYKMGQDFLDIQYAGLSLFYTSSFTLSYISSFAITFKTCCVARAQCWGTGQCLQTDHCIEVTNIP